MKRRRFYEPVDRGFEREIPNDWNTGRSCARRSAHALGGAALSSVWCHVWTAPVSQGLSNIFLARSRSGHVSGLFVRPLMCRWPRRYTCRVSYHPGALCAR